jgi:hypothetical protein
MDDKQLLWQVRAFIYSRFAETTRPPTLEEAARHFDLNMEEAATLYRELHDRHALFLEPGTLNIQMANPFSGIPTDFRVHTNGKTYFANCAWDMLGIPAALHSEALIEAVCAESREPIRLEVRDGKVQAGEVKIHFLLPFARWYEDMAFT